MADPAAIAELLGLQDVPPEVEDAFLRASPLTYGVLKGKYYNPYMERLGMGYAKPVGSLQEENNLNNFILEVQRALMDTPNANP